MGSSGTASAATAPSRDIAQQYRHVRTLSEQYCAPLEIEDYGLQAMADTSPAKWHLAHTSWFFETFLLKPFAPNYQAFHPQFEYLFNSYYNGISEQFSRAQRGLLSRPTVAEVYAYRAHVDAAMQGLLDRVDLDTEVLTRTELGLQHEMQHQELFFTDLKYNFFCNPLRPTYQPHDGDWHTAAADPLQWQAHTGGIALVGNSADNGFCFDNETPPHRVFLEPFSLATRALTNAEVLAFIEDGGYRTPSLWLADGWALLQQQGWQHPLYWRHQDGVWQEFTLRGMQPLDPQRIACHLSGYEADAMARWMQARLPSEFEWECAARQQSVQGHFVDRGEYHPDRASNASLFGDIWQWTRSSYGAYPGYQPAAGAIGEYNGKFMCNQLVLRGGSCVSDARQLRSSYRNFFYPKDRWQVSGVRLARDGA